MRKGVTLIVCTLQKVAFAQPQFIWSFKDVESSASRHQHLEFFCQMYMANNITDGVMFNKRINAVQGLNLDLIGKVQVDQFPILADMFLNLTLLTRGQQNALICGPYWDQVGTSNAPGGCSLHRTWEQQRDAVLGLKEAFPDFVTVKEKVVKNGWWGPDKPRYDFIIQWKKAADYGQRNA